MLSPAGLHLLCLEELVKAGYRGTTIRRARTSMARIARQLDSGNFRKAYMMNEQSFDALVALIKPHMPRRRRSSRSRSPKGPISVQLRVSMTLRYLAGGSVYDISLYHGVGVSTVLLERNLVLDLFNMLRYVMLTSRYFTASRY
jgi:hypothetical protein